MYTQANLPLDPRIREALELYECDSGHSVAVVNGSPNTRYAAATACGGMEDYDLVIASWAGIEPALFETNAPLVTLPGELYEDGEPYELTLYDRITATPDHSASYYVGDLSLCQIEPGVVYYHIPLNCVDSSGDHPPNIEELLLKPIERAMDPEFVETARATALEAELEHFRAFHAEAPERRLREVRHQVERQENLLREYQRNVSDTIGALREQRIRGEVIEAQQHIAPEAAAAEWQRLKEHPRILDVTFNDAGKLVITTDHVTLHHPHGDNEALMGSFRITHDLNDDDETYGIKFENLDSPREGRPHPHVTDTGTACFGEMQQTFTTLLLEAQYIGLYELELEFLESYNPPDDYGRYARRWIEMPFVPGLPTTRDADPNNLANVVRRVAA